MMRFFICFFFLIAITHSSFAQKKNSANPPNQTKSEMKFILSGTVIDKESKIGLEYATVTIFSSKDSSVIGGCLTKSGGSFSIETKIINSFIVIDYIAYTKKIITNIDLKDLEKNSRNINLGDIFLENASILTEELTIREEKSETHFMLDKTVFNVGKDLSNNGGTAEDILDNVPSINVDIDGTITLRGSSGVKILIDGQPSKSASEGNGLRSIPAEMIGSIEVITNPSSRYEAEGTAGIINIILKKEKRSGFNGSFNTSVSYPLGTSIGSSINFRKNKINWFLSYNIQYRSSPGSGFSYQEITQENSDLFITNQTRLMDRSGLSNTLRGGFEYFISPKASITTSLKYKISDDDNFTSIVYEDFLHHINNRTGLKTRLDKEIEEEQGTTANLNYDHEFSNKDHYLRASVQYENDIEIENNQFNEKEESSINDLIQKSKNDEKELNYIFKLDYAQPLGSKKHKYEVGWQSSNRIINNSFQVDSLDKEDLWQPLIGFNNDFEYTEFIHSVYVQYGNEIGKFSFQAGLRAEYASISTELKTTMVSKIRDTLNIFPTLFLNYQVNEKNGFQLSYSKRIRRPRFRDLNPFYSYSNPRNFYTGNPLVDPEYTNSYELNYLRHYKYGTLTCGLFYRHTTDKIVRVKKIIEQNNFITRPENLGINNDYGIEMNSTYKLKKWLNIYGNISVFRSITKSGTNDPRLNVKTFAMTSRVSAKLSHKDHDLQLKMNYRSPRKRPQGMMKSITSVDLAWSKDFLAKKNLTMVLSVRDLLNSRKYRYETIGETFYSMGEFQWRTRSITLSANYRINQRKKRTKLNSKERGGDSGF